VETPPYSIIQVRVRDRVRVGVRVSVGKRESEAARGHRQWRLLPARSFRLGLEIGLELQLVLERERLVEAIDSGDSSLLDYSG
jgi:hypothetical protein